METFRRKSLDNILNKHRHLYYGRVLDIGGKDRGKFKKPKEQVKEWVVADIVESNHPDIVTDVMDMKNIESESFDVINATELFEHVEDIEKGLRECYRVLKKGGTLIITVPFLYPVHADPFDFQRWTEQKWKNILHKTGFSITEFEIMGCYGSILADMKVAFFRALPKPFNNLMYPFYPCLYLMAKLGDCRYAKNNAILKKYHQGYFIFSKKKV